MGVVTIVCCLDLDWAAFRIYLKYCRTERQPQLQHGTSFTRNYIDTNPAAAAAVTLEISFGEHELTVKTIFYVILLLILPVSLSGRATNILQICLKLVNF